MNKDGQAETTSVEFSISVMCSQTAMTLNFAGKGEDFITVNMQQFSTLHIKVATETSYRSLYPTGLYSHSAQGEGDGCDSCVVACMLHKY